LRKVFLGPGATFRNANRNWVYLTFLAVVVALIAWRAVRG
jgi:hypothetical protein